MITRRSQRGLNKKEKEHEGGIGTTPIESPVVGSMALASTPPTSKLGNSVVADPPSLSSSNDETSNSIRKNNPNNMQNTNTAANDSSNNNNSSAEMPVAAAPAATNAGRRSSSRLIRSSPKDSSSSSSPKKKKNTKKLGTPNTTAAEASSSTTKRKTRSDSPAAASASSATTTRNLDGTTGIPKGGATKISLLHPKDPPNGSSAGDEPDDTEGAKQQCETNTNKGPKYLDESTLAWMKRHLDDKASNNNTDGRSVSLLLADALDEDEVMDLSIRLAHQAHERTRQATARVNSSSNMRSPVSTPEPAAAADSEDDDPGSDDMSLFEECLEEEEDQALGHELFKKVVTIAAQQQRPSSTLETPVGPTCHKDDNNKNNNKANSGQENQILDKKTLSWIKRAAGLHRSDVRNIIKNADGSRGRSTRLHTRNQVKDSRRNHKKRERGLDILIVAIADLEDEYGPFPNRILRKTAREKKKSRRAKEADMEEAKSTAANNKNNSKRKRKAEIVELVEPKGRRKQAKLAHKKESKVRICILTFLFSGIGSGSHQHNTSHIATYRSRKRKQ